MQVSVHLTFDGQCRQAFETYCSLFGGEILSLTTFGDTPDGANVPEEWQNNVIHATMSIGDVLVAGADIPPERFQRSQGFNMFADVATPEEAERVFARLSEGGSVNMPMAETFWAHRFGVVVDRFGIPWEVNCGKGE